MARLLLIWACLSAPVLGASELLDRRSEVQFLPSVVAGIKAGNNFNSESLEKIHQQEVESVLAKEQISALNSEANSIYSESLEDLLRDSRPQKAEKKFLSKDTNSFSKEKVEEISKKIVLPIFLSESREEICSRSSDFSVRFSQSVLFVFNLSQGPSRISVDRLSEINPSTSSLLSAGVAGAIFVGPSKIGTLNDSASHSISRHFPEKRFVLVPTYRITKNNREITTVAHSVERGPFSGLLSGPWSQGVSAAARDWGTGIWEGMLSRDRSALTLKKDANAVLFYLSREIANKVETTTLPEGNAVAITERFAALIPGAFLNLRNSCDFYLL
ncbi:hypothetical protein [Leptospira perolatii]|uniref:hypothetical protein n=1 Tax=Leptospira perolatii TaxID=2023191 RepID=UPI000F6411E0|nr:hypothetical protein [Leptospira perolatii]